MPSLTQIGLGAAGVLVAALCVLAYFYKTEVRENIQLQQQNEMRQVEKAGNDAGEKVYDAKTLDEERKNQAVQDAWKTAQPMRDDPVDPALLRVLEASGLYQPSSEPEVPGGSAATCAPDGCGNNK